MSDLVRYTPLYLQVKDLILKKIIDAGYGPGNLLPSESSLAKTYGTSISTIRQAINLMVAEGILSRKQGKGTFIADTRITINFLSWIPETPRGREILENLIRQFEAKNPLLAINLIETNYTHAKEDLLRLISNGTAPDVTQLVSPWTTYFASMGALENISDYLSAENLKTRSFEKDLSGGTYNGKIYSVAWGLCPISLIVNKNVLANAGIPIGKVPLDLSDFEDICARLSKRFDGVDNYCFGLNVRHDETDFLRIYSFLQAFGGGFVNDEGKVVFNSRENMEGFAWIKQFTTNNKIFSGDIYSIRDRFARNEIAFIMDGPWIKYILEELTGEDFDTNFRVILNPTIRSGASLSWNYNHALAICSQSRNKEYAGRFIDQITNDPELSAYYYSTTGHLHSNTSILEASEYDNEFSRAFRDQLANSKCINASNSMFEKAMVLCLDAVKKILFEEADIEKELNEKEYYLNMLYYG